MAHLTHTLAHEIGAENKGSSNLFIYKFGSYIKKMLVTWYYKNK